MRERERERERETDNERNLGQKDGQIFSEKGRHRERWMRQRDNATEGER
jgi:hypothetical protein